MCSKTVEEEEEEEEENEEEGAIGRAKISDDPGFEVLQSKNAPPKLLYFPVMNGLTESYPISGESVTPFTPSLSYAAMA